MLTKRRLECMSRSRWGSYKMCLSLKRSIRPLQRNWNYWRPAKLLLESTFQTFRDIILETLKETCGTIKHSRGLRKATAKWNDVVKEAINVKIRLFMQCLKLQLDCGYTKYQTAKDHCKRVVNTAKDAS